MTSCTVERDINKSYQRVTATRSYGLLTAITCFTGILAYCNNHLSVLVKNMHAE